MTDASRYHLTVGLEIHAELRTHTKMFCNSKNDPDEKRPNVNVCPVCLGYPGTLPVINKEAVRHVLRVGAAVGGTCADFTEFDRKNYFYPDIPKGYQISQYKYPLVSGGSIAGVALTRIHLEEDTAKSTHDKGDHSLVDFNRAGVPLLELVTEPVIHDAETAGRFARELQLLLQYLGASEANMEKGEMRVEANISVSSDPQKLGTKVEVKNLNSFRAVERAVAFEMSRHIALLEKGEAVEQETRGWNETTEETFSQRKKEDSHDYRYFPDPDLPKLRLSDVPEFGLEALKATLPELPWQKRERLVERFGLKTADAEVYVRDAALASFFEEAAAGADGETAARISNYLLSEVRSVEGTKLTPQALFETVALITAGEISSRGAKEILKKLAAEGGQARSAAEALGVFQKSDEGEMRHVAEQIITENEQAVTEYKAGKTASLQYLVGQGMKASKGSANPQVLKKIFEELLS